MPVVDAANPADKPALVPLACRVVRERTEVKKLLAERDAALEAAGHPLQVTSDPAALPLFARVGSDRLLLLETGSKLSLKGHDGSFSAEEVVERFTSGAWLPSFSALTRPLAASVLFPVAATILGPAEIAYWAQAWPLFSWAGIVPPVPVPRPLVALVPAATERVLSKLGLSVEDVLEGEEAMLRKKGAGEARPLLERLAAIRENALRALDAEEPALLAVDPSLEKAVQATREKTSFAFEKLVEKAAAAAGRADERTAAQVNRLARGDPARRRPRRARVLGAAYVLKFGREAVVGALRQGARLERAGTPGDFAVNVSPVDVLAFSPHPDDAELGCGGTLAALAARGLTFGIVDLTRGEMATRGTPEIRAREARRGRADPRGALPRDARPRGRRPEDGPRGRAPGRRGRPPGAAARRPRAASHGSPSGSRARGPPRAGGRLVRGAREARDRASPPHRPDQVVFYATYVLVTPTFLVDVSATFATKVAALRAYRSQFYDPNSGEPETYVSSKGFFDGIEARARALGRIANVEYAEGFVSNAPPTLADPVAAFLGYEGGKRT